MSWTETNDRCAPWLLRLGWAVVRRFGWFAGRAIALGAVAWYLLSSRRARRASADYLARVLGRRASPLDIARHFDQFGCAVLDRVMLLAGREADYDITVDGLAPLLAAVDQGRGAILLGAHLGSFEVLRTLARNAPAPVWALMYRRNIGPLAALLDQIAPEIRAQVLEIGDTASMIRARECVERGEIVGILADRSPPGHRLVPAPFLGGTAQFPSGPFVLASTLGAPVFLFHGVSTGRRRYKIGIEPFADRVVLRRTERHADLRSYIHTYAAGLERLCRAYPFQWFNFFPFWEPPAAPEPSSPRLVARRSTLLLPFLIPARARAEPFPLAELMARLAAIGERRAVFREQRRFAALTDVLESRGHLLYRRPDYLEKVTDWPIPERMVIDGARLVITAPGNDPPQVVDLAGQPELRILAEGMRGPLAGDLGALRRSFAIEAGGSLSDWTLNLTPIDPRAAKLLRAVRLSGRDSWIGDLRLIQANGDEQWMRIEPA